MSIRFKGCTLFGELPATSAGLSPGEIQVSPVKGRLGYIEKATHDVGVVLEPVAGGKPFAEFAIEGYPLRTVVGEGNNAEGTVYPTGGNDGIISPITPINKMTGTFTQVYSKNANHENVPSKFEGEHIELLESYVENTEESHSYQWSRAAQSITNVNTVEGEAEIKG